MGELRSWDAAQVVVTTPKGDEAINTQDILSLRWGAGPTDNVAVKSVNEVVELSDGSQLPALEYESASSKSSFKLAGSNAAVEVERRQLAAVQLKPLEGELAKQWTEIRDLKPAADMLILLKKDGKSLDYIEGVLGAVTPDKIEFELDGDKMQINRGKVAGMVYFQREAAAEADPHLAVRGRGGLRANATAAELMGDGSLAIETPAGVKLRLPLDEVYLADFSAGKLVYVSDLEAGAENWSPLVAWPKAASIASEYGKVRRDTSAYGGPLTLRTDERSASPNPSSQSFSKGLALRSRSEVSYRLPAGFRRLNAVAGIDPSGNGDGNVRLQIIGDDRTLFEADVAAADAPRPIDIDIAGVKRLKFVVDFGQNLDTGDWLNLCDLRILK